MGIHLGHGHTLTAAHLVDGDLRTLTVDGRPAEVVALSSRLDLALLLDDGAPGIPTPRAAAALTTRPEPAPDPEPGSATMLGPDGASAVAIDAVVTLQVHDLTDGVRHERPALRLVGAVEPGESGSPVVDDDGRLLGVVVLTDRVGGVTYATQAPADPADLPTWTGRRGCSDG